MTDPTGKVFLSYKHDQQEIATLLEDTFREHGILVWRDESNLRSEPLEAELQQVLEDSDEIASGVLLVSDSVANSEIILELELPSFQNRWDAGDEFFVVIVRCPDISVDTAKTILAESSSLHDFSPWYMEQLDATTPKAAAKIADSVLKHRIEQIHANLPPGQPIECSLDTYEAPAHDPAPAIAIDWSTHFEQGLPTQAVWTQRLLPAVTTVTDRLSQEAPGRSLQFRGRAHLPASFALGRCLRETRSIQTTWMQSDQSGNANAWTLDRDEEESGLTGELTRRTVGASDLAVLVSITDDVQPEVGNTKSALPDFNGILELTPEDGSDVHLRPPQAAHAATVFRDEVRTALNELSNTSKIHLFMAVPTGLAFLFGQQTNTFPPTQTYILPNGARTYQRAVLLSNQQTDIDQSMRTSKNKNTLSQRILGGITDWITR